MRAARNRVVALGGGHGLFTSLSALRRVTRDLTAIATVADDGGSSGRLRREFGVLELLFLKQGVILNKVAFLNHLYTGMEEPEMKTIDVIICRLRKKLAVAGVPTLIDTVWGCGYILRDPSLPPEPLPAEPPAWATQVAVAA